MADTSRLTPELVFMAIENGMLDQSLDGLDAAITERQRVMASRAADELKIGDVFVIRNCSPKYFVGVQVRYLRREGHWLVCSPIERYAANGKKLPTTVNLRESHVGTKLGNI